MNIRKWEKNLKPKELLWVGTYRVKAGNNTWNINARSVGQKMEALELLVYRMKLNITDEREVAVDGPGIYSESKWSESMRLPSLRTYDKHNTPPTKANNKYSG